MLKVTYTEMGLCLEYCPETLDWLLSDRVCTLVHAQQALSIQPIRANIPIPVALMRHPGWDDLAPLEVTRCDRDWVEITVPGLWLSDDPDTEQGIFWTELESRIEQRLWCLWQLAQRHRDDRPIGKNVA